MNTTKSKLERSKRSLDQRGLASIVIVGILITLLTLISIGFARITSRSINTATDTQSSKAADYAAQSALNDAVAFMKAKSPSQVQADQCADLLSSSNPQGSEFLSGVNPNISGDKNTEYSCILVDPKPKDLVYQQIPAFKSQVIQMNDSGFNDFRKLMFSWQSADRTKQRLPTAPTLSLTDEANWSNQGYAPMLRLSLYPVPGNDVLGPSRANARTYFLYPCTTASTACPSSISSGVVHYGNPGLVPDGSLVPVNCSFKGEAFMDAGIFGDTADYDCNVVIDNIADAATPGQVDYFYVRLTPLYSQADIKIKANADSNSVLTFEGVQSIVDVTAKSAGTAKRLQARVDIGTNNVGPDEDAVPEYAMRTAMALCKRLSVEPINTTSSVTDCAPLLARAECSDNVDNADPEDSVADFGVDPGCTSRTDPDETDPPPPPPPPPVCPDYDGDGGLCDDLCPNDPGPADNWYCPRGGGSSSGGGSSGGGSSGGGSSGGGGGDTWHCHDHPSGGYALYNHTRDPLHTSPIYFPNPGCT